MPEQKTKPIYEEIINSIDYNSLSHEWLKTNVSYFSDKISLFDYQQEAVKNALKLLCYYFENLQKYQKTENELTNIERKKELFKEIMKYEKSIDSLGITDKNKLLFNKIKNYYPVIEENSREKIHFLHFVNRMSFWMATGSGKTIVLVKLIELLDNLKQSNLIPNNDILILTQRDDLIDQIKDSIKEFNKQSKKKIILWDLKKYDEVKRGNVFDIQRKHKYFYLSF